MSLLFRLYFEFFKTGLFAVGGGMATVPFLQDISRRTGWFTTETLINLIAVSESTPGPIGVNMATYTGFVTAGLPGAVIATLGLTSPSIIVILLVAMALKAFKDNKYVEYIFYGIRPASAALIASAWFTVARICLTDIEAFKSTGRILSLFEWKGLILFAVIWLLTNKVNAAKSLHPLTFIAMAAVIGIVFGGAL